MKLKTLIFSSLGAKISDVIGFCQSNSVSFQHSGGKVIPDIYFGSEAKRAGSLILELASGTINSIELPP